MKKILLIAEQANPDWVSVPLVGWSLANAIANLVDAHIVTQVRNRAAFIRAGHVEGEQFSALDSEYLARPFHQLATILKGGSNKGWTTVSAFNAFSYYAFEHEVWKTFGSRIRQQEFGLVHRITPLSPAAPSLLAKKCASAGVPFFLGPINGGLPWPKGFENRRRAEKEWLASIRGMYRVLPGSRSMYRYAKRVFVASDAAVQDVPESCRKKILRIPENGVNLSRFSLQRTRAASMPLTAVFVGRLVPCKCPDILINAACDLVRSGRLRLRFVGDGPMRGDLQALAQQLGITSGIDFLGWVPHEKIQETLIDADCLVLPSIREFGGGVVLEAMACGVAPIVADYGGPAELVVPGTGIKVPFSDEESLQINLHRVLTGLVNSPSQLDCMSIEARRYVQEQHTWEAKARRIVAAYEDG